YEGAPGLLTLRRQVARRAVEAGVALSENDLCTTIGATEALSLALRAVAKPGDIIAVESPAYFGVLQTIEGLGLRALEVPANPRTGLDVTALEETLRTQPIRAVVVTPTISNPLGSIMPDEERERLVRITKRYDVPIIEDDVYAELVFDGSRPRPLRAFAGPSEDSHVLLVGSVSKTLAPGYRVGWLAGGRWHDQVVRLKYSHTLACPALLGMAVAEFLASGGYDRHLRRLRAALAGNVERYREMIATEFPEGTRVSAPRGGFVLWVELPPGVDALQLHDQALRRRIVIAPGPLFSARQRFANFIRISAGTPWSERIAEGMRTLGRLIARE
ncbi:MAG: PLP-dependent aminotransferase family protein, partial [Solirubrobacteraceae bacterium]